MTTVFQGSDNDDLLEAGADTGWFSGGLGIDTMRGGDGDDGFVAGQVDPVAQADVIEGGAGDDTYYIYGQADAGTVTFDGGVGTDTLQVNNYDGAALIDLTGMTLTSVETLSLVVPLVKLTSAQAQSFSRIEGSGDLSIVGSSDLSATTFSDRRGVTLEGNNTSLTMSVSYLWGLSSVNFSGTNGSLIIADPSSWTTADLRSMSLVGVANIVAHGEYLQLTMSAAQFSQLSTISMDGARNSTLLVEADPNGGLVDLSRAGLSGIGAGILVGGNGLDTLSGTAGNDTFRTQGTASTQRDLIYGNDGDDRYLIGEQADAGTVTFDGGAGTDTLVSGSGSPIDITGMTLSSVEVLDLLGMLTHSLTMTGAQANSFTTISGGTGQDRLTIVGSADLSGAAMTRVEAITLNGAGATLALNKDQAAALTSVTISDPTSTLQVTASMYGGIIDLSRAGISGVGHSLVRGDAGVDTLRGGAGDDVFLSLNSPTAQSDIIEGGAGNDRYQVARQQDAGTVRFDGGIGTDTLEIATNSSINLTGMTLIGVETLELSGTQAHNVTLSGTQVGVFTSLTGGAGHDVLTITGSANLSAKGLTGIDAIVLSGIGATLTLDASQMAGLALTGNGNTLAVTTSGSGAIADVSGAVGFGQIVLTGTVGADDLTVGAGATITGNGGDDVFHLAAGISGAVTITDGAIGDRMVFEGVDLTTLQIETAAGATTLRVGSTLAVTLTGSFDVSQFQSSSGSNVTIVQANHAPVAEPGKMVTAQAGSPVALGITAPTDTDGDALTVTVTGIPAGGTVKLFDGTAVSVNQSLTTAELGGLTFTPGGGTIGSAGSFTYTVADDRGGTAGQSVALTVNAAPVAEANKTVTAQAGASVALGIALPTDANADALSVTVTSLPTGGTLALGDGTAVSANQTLTTADLGALIFTPTAGTIGAAGTFTYTVADGRGGSAGQSVALMVNAAPVAEADKTVTAHAGAPMSLGIAAPTDANADALTVTVTGLPAGGTIHLFDGTAVSANQSMTTAQLAALTFTPTAGTIGAAGFFSYTVIDGHGGSAGQTVNLTVMAAPVVLPPLPPSDGSGGSATPSPVSPTRPGPEPSQTGDRLVGGDGNDFLFSSHRGNTFIGHRGVDTVRVNGAAAQFRVDVLDHTTATTTSLAELNGVDTLQGVEILQFDDGIRLITQPTLTQDFNEEAYLMLHRDVAAAVGAGLFRSGAEHYARFGAAEGRAPSLAVDEAFYRAQNPDVDHAIVVGQFQSATEHYLLHGNAENRAPSALFDPNWYLAANPDVAAAVGRGETTAFGHYSQFGWREDRDPSMWFDTSGYEARYQDVAAAGVNPLTHFLTYGQSEGRVAPSVDFGLWV